MVGPGQQLLITSFDAVIHTPTPPSYLAPTTVSARTVAVTILTLSPGHLSKVAQRGLTLPGRLR